MFTSSGEGKGLLFDLYVTLLYTIHGTRDIHMLLDSTIHHFEFATRLPLTQRRCIRRNDSFEIGVKQSKNRIGTEHLDLAFLKSSS